MKALFVIVGAVLLPSVALAAITNIGPLFPATNFLFTQTMPTGMPAINTAGSVAGLSFTVFSDDSEQEGVFRYSHGTMSNLGLGGIIGITDDGAAWGAFVDCGLLSAGIQRLDKHGSCTGLPSSTNAIGVSVSSGGQWVLGQAVNGFGRPMLAWQVTAPGTYAFYNLGAAADPFTDQRFSNPTSFSATNINARGEFAVTASNTYTDALNNPVAVFHAYLYRINAGVAMIAVDLGEGVIADAIDDLGDVAGLGAPLVGGNPQRPFIYKGGTVQTWDLSSIPGWAGIPPSIVGLNNAGQVAFSLQLTDSVHSFLRQKSGRFVDVGSIFPAGHITNMFAAGLNSVGQITGWGVDLSVFPSLAYYTWIFTP